MKMILDVKRLKFVQPLYHFHRSDYSWQVAPQQSLLPLHLTKQNSIKTHLKNQLFLTTLPEQRNKLKQQGKSLAVAFFEDLLLHVGKSEYNFAAR
jgi:hypothetical protein